MILVAYASKHGATEGIAQHIARSLNEAGREADARSVTDVHEFGAPDAVVIGSAVYAGSWRKEAVEFVESHADELARLPVWLFSSGRSVSRSPMTKSNQDSWPRSERGSRPAGTRCSSATSTPAS
jgi:menaquinone-dependent protoporphyrinogen IX oxidase